MANALRGAYFAVWCCCHAFRKGVIVSTSVNDAWMLLLRGSASGRMISLGVLAPAIMRRWRIGFLAFLGDGIYGVDGVWYGRALPRRSVGKFFPLSLLSSLV